MGTNPRLADSDGDQFTDAEEVIGVETPTGIQPTNPRDDDTDDDGWTDGFEVDAGTNPLDDRSRPGRRDG